MNNCIKYLWLTILSITLWGACKKDKDYIPYVYVDEYIYTTDPAFIPINIVAGYIYWRGGSQGIIIFRKSLDEFVAYDRHCTHEVDKGNRITVEPNGILAKDSVCSSQYFLTDGSVNSGPANRPLKQYEVTFDGSVLHIFN